MEFAVVAEEACRHSVFLVDHPWYPPGSTTPGPDHVAAELPRQGPRGPVHATPDVEDANVVRVEPPDGGAFRELAGGRIFAAYNLDGKRSPCPGLGAAEGREWRLTSPRRPTSIHRAAVAGGARRSQRLSAVPAEC